MTSLFDLKRIESGIATNYQEPDFRNFDDVIPSVDARDGPWKTRRRGGSVLFQNKLKIDKLLEDEADVTTEKKDVKIDRDKRYGRDNEMKRPLPRVFGLSVVALLDDEGSTDRRIKVFSCIIDRDIMPTIYDLKVEIARLTALLAWSIDLYFDGIWLDPSWPIDDVFLNITERVYVTRNKHPYFKDVPRLHFQEYRRIREKEVLTSNAFNDDFESKVISWSPPDIKEHLVYFVDDPSAADVAPPQFRILRDSQGQINESIEKMESEKSNLILRWALDRRLLLRRLVDTLKTIGRENYFLKQIIHDDFDIPEDGVLKDHKLLKAREEALLKRDNAIAVSRRKKLMDMIRQGGNLTWQEITETLSSMNASGDDVASVISKKQTYEDPEENVADIYKAFEESRRTEIITAKRSMNEKQRAQRRAKLEQSMRRRIIFKFFKDLIMYIILVITLSVVSFSRSSDSLLVYDLDNSLRSTMNPIPSNMTNVFNMDSMSDVWQQMNRILESAYDPLDLKQPPVYQIFNRVFGSVRMRQLRVNANNDCQIDSHMAATVSNCYPLYTMIPNTQSSADFPPFTYLADTGNSILIGEFTMYGNGGYVVDIPMTSINETRRVMKWAQENKFIDLGTRLVTLDINTYNAGMNLFSSVRIIFEFAPEGGVCAWISSFESQFFLYETSFDKMILGFEILLVIWVGVYILIEMYDICSYGIRRYHFDFWVGLEHLNVLILLVVFGLRAAELTMIQNLNLKIDNLTTYYNCYDVGSIMEIEKQINAINLFLNTLRSLFFLTYFKTLKMLVTSILFAAKDILYFIMTYVIIIFAFAQVGVLWFGNSLSSFKDVQTALLSCFMGSLGGGISYAALSLDAKFTAPIYYILFIIMAVFILLRVAISILIVSYAKAKRAMMADLSDSSFTAAQTILRKSLQDKVGSVKEFFSTKIDIIKGIEENLAVSDVDGDGLVSKEELEMVLHKYQGVSDILGFASANEILAEYDVNNDGVLDQDEMKELFKFLKIRVAELEMLRDRQIADIDPEVARRANSAVQGGQSALKNLPGMENLHEELELEGFNQRRVRQEKISKISKMKKESTEQHR